MIWNSATSITYFKTHKFTETIKLLLVKLLCNATTLEKRDQRPDNICNQTTLEGYTKREAARELKFWSSSRSEILENSSHELFNKSTSTVDVGISPVFFDFSDYKNENQIYRN